MAAPDIISIVCGPIETNVYLVVAGEGGKESDAWIIDPAPESAQRVLDEAKKRDVHISIVINTHGHWDHTTDNARLKRETNARIAIHSADNRMVGGSADILLEEGQELSLGDSTFKVMHTPGHTPGSVCLLDEANHILFSGDTLFKNGHGRTDLPGGSDTQMMQSLRRLAALPPETAFYPGHGADSTIGGERWLQKGA